MQKYIQQFNHLRKVGNAAIMLLTYSKKDPKCDVDIISLFSTKLFDEPNNEKDTSELHEWIWVLLNIYYFNTRTQDSCIVDKNMNPLTKGVDNRNAYPTSHSSNTYCVYLFSN